MKTNRIQQRIDARAAARRRQLIENVAMVLIGLTILALPFTIILGYAR